MEFRIGINLGDVIEEGDRIFGDGVNIAARLEALADPGGICISKTAFDQIETKLPLGYEYLGEKEVKNIAKPVGAFRVLMDAEAAGKVIGELKPKTKQLRWAAVGALAVLVIGAGALAIWNFYFRPPFEPASLERMAFPLPDKPSIAVLPFDSLSADPENESLADRISESIIYTLSYLPDMLVISRNSTFIYKGKPVKIRKVAEELGVRYVLEGSVMRTEDRVRVIAQLIDATNGYHVWSGRYDRTMKDFFDMLDEITKTIAIELQVKISDKWAGLTRKTNNFDAWAYVIKAYGLVIRLGKENIFEAHRLTEKAVELDPTYGFAWGTLAAVHTIEAAYGYSESPAQSLKLAAELNEKSLKLDPTLSCVTANRGQIYRFQGKIDDAIALGKKAIAMGPSLSINYALLSSTMRYAGRFEESIALMKKAMRLNPFYPVIYLNSYGTSLLMAKRYKEALDVYKELLNRAQKGDFAPLFAHLGLCAVYAELGNDEEARVHVSEIMKINPRFSLESARKIARYRDPQHSERWLSSLRKAGLPETPPLPLPDKPSIAVLPFVNMSGDPEQEYFSDGIAEEIITALSKSSQLFVIARESTFSYKGKQVKVQQIGRELGVRYILEGVRYILEGSVRKSEDRVRITAQLVDAIKGQHLWAERYDRDLQDIFALQDEITMKIVTALRIKLTEGEQARMWGKQFKNLDVYLKHMEALALFRKGTKESLIRFGQVAQEVIDMAPEYAIGHRLLAVYYWSLATIIGKSPREAFTKAFELAQKALALDESDSICRAILGSIYVSLRQYEKAIAAGERSIELEPNGAMVHGLLGRTLSYAGRPDEAIDHLKQGIRLNPFPAYWYFFHLGRCYNLKGQNEEALATYKKALQRAPDFLYTHVGITGTYSLLGREEEARAAAKKVLEINPNFSVAQLSKIVPYKNQADTKRLIDALRKAGLK
jgi:adenylate cyclase